MNVSPRTTRTWLITGASSGIGGTLATTLLERGEQVVVTARDRERVGEFERRYPGRAIAAECDVTDPAAARAAMAAAVAAFGRVDVVVNNAGYGLFGALEELPDDELRRQFETNVFGSLNVARAALPQLRQQRSGHIVQISSLEGVAPMLAGETAYAATKFAVEGMCEALAKEVAHLGVRVTIVEPGPVRTDFAGGASAKSPEIEDYDDSVGEALRLFAQLAGNQPNDPVRVAEAIIEAVDADQPPLRLALGGEAAEAIRAKLDGQRRDLDAWDHLARSTAFAS
ncbi:oxidoreductase [Rugosimonospora africana]|uniref:Short-chain dehydrogenase/reductase n=1 Tax=Rugosimonospora africana TaxID=556532 RepID=A0A8J3VV48_9ACTN|nr:oxidoreductase [Rugosimonospora africana]GIH19900.1 short-chain dehydrogenase/reductase [Rugosimonospora africana]